MEKIENNVCSIFIDESYRNFTKALNLINNTTDKNINEIYDRVLVISDENVYKTQLNKFIDLLNAKFVSEYIVPAGEESKCIDTFEKILEHGLKAGLTRKSLIIRRWWRGSRRFIRICCSFIYERYRFCSSSNNTFSTS